MPFPFDLKSQLGRSDNPLIKCACGRDVNLDMMRDVRPFVATTGWTESHRCDSCCEHLHRNDIVSRETFYRAHGAPVTIVALHAARDKVMRDEREAVKAMREGRNV